MNSTTLVGVDIGSVSVAVASVFPDGRLNEWKYAFHNGLIAETTRTLLDELDLPADTPLAITASSPRIVKDAYPVDWLSAHVAIHRLAFPSDRMLLIVGGERFGLVQFDEKGSYRSSRGNSGCAAGTGGFLDQQAQRLGLADAAALANEALSNTGTSPKVASRCSVFAKTDLIHAQQEGYSLPEICDGLCEGLARNLVDVLVSQPLPQTPVVMAGGVARNGAVVGHVSRLLDRRVVAPEYAPAMGAAGAAVELARELASGGAATAGETAQRDETAGSVAIPRDETAPAATLAARVEAPGRDRSYHYPPLAAPTDYPDFTDHEQFSFEPSVPSAAAVEVDKYVAPQMAAAARLYLGVDIGSTSTKAVLTDEDGAPRWAFYTRTAGKPLVAVRGILEAIEATVAPANNGAPDARIPIAAVSTTGSGRKFIGGVLGADIVLDEITAHARAAVELNPAVDTIIEIGGQDAKFTTVKNRRVTFSQMNSVCAAGTGSFIEEQAHRLNVPITEYASRCIGTPAPLTSDRCTVFMERDINHYLNNGYSTDEILTAALHSVRENYLQKVAERSSIGSVVCFQGATAKNEALVAAFETELGRPIAVSRYCHVTGALGAALTCIDEGITESSFRGIDLYKSDIPVRSERCSLCTNHCRLRIAKVGEEEVAFGFLCGRDYETASFVSANKAGFDLAAARRKIERAVARPKRGEPIVAELDPDESRFFVQVGRRADDIKNAFVGFVESTSDRVGRAVTQQQSRSHSLRPIEPTAPRRVPTLGVPAGLHLAEEHHYFQRVFAELGIPTRSSAGAEDVVAVGKKLEGAEFCSPVAAFHGHVEKMLETADLVFVPVVLERDDTGERRRSYCYYTQFTSSMLTGVVPPEERNRLVSPVLYGVGIDPAAELYQALTSHYAITLPQVRLAMNRARRALADSREQLKALFAENRRAPTDGEIDVVILGRPYTAMDPGMNKSIPQIFERAGVRAFFQDMLPDSLPTEETGLLLQSVHWRYAAEILLAADVASRTPGLYPVFVTSFKCAPDSFCQDAFKRIMESRDKPYLILQLDEHDSNVGYETRIEAAIRAFRNHHAMIAAGPLATREEVRAAGEGTKSDGPIMPKLERVVRGRTLLLPNWDTITIPLIAANLRAHGIDAVALTETPQSIQQSMRLNSGQCIPVSALAQEAMDYVRESGRSAEEFVLWMIQGDWACGIPLYPSFIKSLFHQEGLGEIGVFVGEITFTDIAPAATIGAYFAYQFGGWLRALSCRIRPYEQNEGQTNAVLERAHKRLLRVIENKGNRLRWLRETVDAFTAIPTYGQQKPKVAIFGDLYVRDNDVMNQGLIETIEAAGGEAITTPYSDYVKLIAGTTFERMRSKGLYGNLAKFRVIVGLIDRLEKRYHREVEDILGPPLPWRIPGQRRDLAKFGMVIEQSGESFDNALKILHLISRHDDIALFVQASPAFCCPSLVTEALSGAIEAATGVPIVTVTYDGTGADKNASIIPYIKFPRVTASA